MRGDLLILLDSVYVVCLHVGVCMMCDDVGARAIHYAFDNRRFEPEHGYLRYATCARNDIRAGPDWGGADGRREEMDGVDGRTVQLDSRQKTAAV